ncbi:hypothetical protein ACA910_009002 [Epithemia clementina (nom. ined.)]
MASAITQDYASLTALFMDDGKGREVVLENDDSSPTTFEHPSSFFDSDVRTLVKTTLNGNRSYQMIDVRSNNALITPKHELLANFVAPDRSHLGSDSSHTIFQASGKIAHVDHDMAGRRLPTEILYDKEGLRLFDEITRMESQEYYLTACEEDILKNQMYRLIPFIPDGCAIVELGCGSMAKTAVFLDAIRKAGKKDICFYAIDIEQTSLESSIEDLIAFEEEQQGNSDNKFRYSGILGSYNQALETNVLKNLGRPKVFLWLGSSIGNWTRDDATEFLSTFSDSVMQPFDLFMIGMDQRNDPDTIARAYNDSAGITRDFGLNGLRHLNKLIGQNVFNVEDFEYFAGYNVKEGRHEAYLRSKKDQSLAIPAEFSPLSSVVNLKENELINYEFSYKYSIEEIQELCNRTRFHLSELLFDSTNRYRFAVLSKAAFAPVPKNKVGRATFPELYEFEEVWKLWHTLTSPVIMKNPLEKPIQLRHPLIFYVGHIPAFEDIHQSRHLGEPLTEPTYFASIFERGINPVVEDPSKCHAHSEVPDQWPDIETVRAYASIVHDRVRRVVGNITFASDGKIEPGKQRLGRQLSVCLEHTIMHAETYVYMLVQLQRELLPKSLMPAYLRSVSHVTKPIKSAYWMDIQQAEVESGIDNYERDDGKSALPISIEFGWDNETPVRKFKGQTSLRAQSRPVTCYEYLHFIKTIDDNDERKQLVPGSWIELADGKYAMLTLFGPIEVERCMNCPVTLSYKLAEKYQKHLQTVLGDPTIRIPTEEEWVVMQSQIKDNDCHEDIDFHNWMPAPLKEDTPHKIGSVWEWTSTVFDSYSGFEQSQIYPGYSADFFDGLHNVVRGGSWCTHGRVANRLRNFYQRSYPYAFIGVRFVRDVAASELKC